MALTVQQQQQNLEALIREIENERAVIKNLGITREKAVEMDSAKNIEWADEEIKQHQEALDAAQKALDEAVAQASPQTPYVQKRGPGRPRKETT